MRYRPFFDDLFPPVGPCTDSCQTGQESQSHVTFYPPLMKKRELGCLLHSFTFSYVNVYVLMSHTDDVWFFLDTWFLRYKLTYQTHRNNVFLQYGSNDTLLFKIRGPNQKLFLNSLEALSVQWFTEFSVNCNFRN